MGRHPFTTIEKNTGMVVVQNEKLERLKEVVGREKEGGEVRVVPATIKFVDIAGLVKGAHKGEGLGNEFLGHIREVDVVCHVVRVFEDSRVLHVMGGVDSERDVGVVETELILKDLESLETRKKTLGIEKELVEKLISGLNEGKMIKDLGLNEEEKERIRDLFLLTDKPAIYVFNVAENQISRGSYFRLPVSDSLGLVLCAKLEEELFDLEPEEQKEYLESLDLEELGVDQLIKKCFNLLGLLTFYTIAGGKIVQAWPIKKGATALEAADLVHSDMARGFIKAEVIDFDELVKTEGWAQAKEEGKIRLEGKNYPVKEGEVIEFRFKV